MPVFHSENLKLQYTVDGAEDAPPLVLLNSLGTNLHMWDAQVKLLSPALRLIRYDNRGHGKSEVPTGPCTIEQYAGDVLALLDTLGLERAHICGLSLGGVIAQWLAIYHPERVISVTLANTTPRIGTVEIWDQRIAGVQELGLAGIQEAVIARFLSAAFRQRDPEETERIRSMLLACTPTGYIAACWSLRELDLWSQVRSIHRPTLTIASELDESTPADQMRALHAAIPGSQFVHFPGVAHLSNIERPEALSACVLELVTRSK